MAVNAVGVNPEPKAHVIVDHQVHDSPTANVGVAVGIPILELNHHLTSDRINRQPTHSIRSARIDVEEHASVSKLNSASLCIAFITATDA